MKPFNINGRSIHKSTFFNKKETEVNFHLLVSKVISEIFSVE